MIYELAKNFSVESIKIFRAFIRSYSIYTGVSTSYYTSSTSSISSRFYIHKPYYIDIRSRRTGYPGLYVIVSEIPTPRKNSYNEQIVVVSSIFYERKPVSKQHLLQKLKTIIKYVPNHKGDQHFFMYFIGRKFRAGALEQIKKLYAKSGKTITKPIEYLQVSGLYDIAINDILYYLLKRVIALLESPGFKKSNNMVFGHPKKLAEYVLCLLSVTIDPSIEDYFREVRSSTEYPVDQLLGELYNSYYKIKRSIEEQIKEKNSSIRAISYRRI